MLQDKLSTIAFVKEGKFTSHRIKHIPNRYLFIKEKVDEEEIEVLYKPTLKMLADTFHKRLKEDLFRG